MTASALRRNPRRIKQFVNNLDVRLRTIEAREASGRIEPKISDDVLGIAKLAIIEEEWRADYGELEDDPRKLAEWDREVQTGTSVKRPIEFTTFLRMNLDVVPRNVAATIKLKLEAIELELPGFSEFREAVAYGDFATAIEIVNAAPEEQRPGYSARLPELLRRELTTRATTPARAILDASLQDAPLGVEDPETRRRMFADALAQPDVVAQFPALPPAKLFGTLDLLTKRAASCKGAFHTIRAAVR